MDGIVESCGVEALSDHLLERIFTFVNPYYGLNNVQAVSKRWYRVSQSAVARMKRMYYKCNNFAWKLADEDFNQGHLLTERCSHSACFYPQEHAMYLFGGCTSRFAAFNDLWKFDLSSREWERVMISKGPLPSAKALASLVVYRDDLILYGGFSKSSMNPIHQTTSFYKEIHLYNRRQNCWEEIFSENTAPHLAGHSVSIIGDFMLVFGGSMGSSYNNNVYVLDIQSRIWNMPSIPGPCPHPRYGQTQILLDNNHLVIIGGCGGPSVMLNDVWMLEFDMDFQRGWKWTQLKVENQELTPPYMWCHRGVKVGSNAVLLSRPIRNHLARGRRRTSRSNSNSNRLSSPDSPSDRRAVAAAFSNVNLTKQPENRVGSSNLTPRKKPMLLSSKSLDEQDQKQSPYGREGYPSQSSLQVNTAGHGSYLGKSSELHRACSIPAIIVGEIPKLIVTSSTETSQKPPSSIEKK
ncbi:Kelch motif family protein [Aphelenchoides avenae]|nr:Kelch motif family protein [Aphelenchus avenae]